MGCSVSRVISDVSWEHQTAKRAKLRAQLGSYESYKLLRSYKRHREDREKLGRSSDLGVFSGGS